MRAYRFLCSLLVVVSPLAPARPQIEDASHLFSGTVGTQAHLQKLQPRLVHNQSEAYASYSWDHSNKLNQLRARFISETTTRINPVDGAEMIFVPVGEFIMGSEEDETEKPTRQVYLGEYWIYKTEVTVGQYRRFCDATGRAMPERPYWGWINSHAIINVSWNDARAYCQWAGVRLPTEAEWEKAARGIDGRKYPWGNTWDASKARYDANGTAAVGSYPADASSYGVLDMAGNVGEWCNDWWDETYYQNAPNRNPVGPPSGDMRVVRGGSWSSDDPFWCRTSARDRYSPSHTGRNLGFRCTFSR